jgi:glutathione synthase/RimK-type ligase-like ATP-grasp enzyme
VAATKSLGLPDTVQDPVHRRLALSEAGTAFQGLYQAMDALWINSPVYDAAASHKPYQLSVAQEIGLEIPPTMMTSDPDEARAFWVNSTAPQRPHTKQQRRSWAQSRIIHLPR